MPPINNLKSLIIYGFLVLRWIPFFIVAMLFRIWKIGPRQYFHVKARLSTPKCLLDPALGQHGYVQLKNVKLHYVASGQRGNPLMVMLHGFPEFWYSWRYQIRAFSDKFRVVAIDMRGYGDSESKSPVKDYYLDTLAEDVKGVIHAFGYEKCIIVGHDWGGIIAWRVASLWPQLVQKLIVCNAPHPDAITTFLIKSRTQRYQTWYIFFFQIPWLPEIFLRSEDITFVLLAMCNKKYGITSGYFTEEDLEAYKFAYSKKGAFTGPLNYYRALIRYRLKNPGLKTTCPTLMIWGTRDSLVKELAEITCKDYAHNAIIRYIDGASHWVQQEQPKIVNKIIRDYLNNKKHI